MSSTSIASPTPTGFVDPGRDAVQIPESSTARRGARGLLRRAGRRTSVKGQPAELPSEWHGREEEVLAAALAHARESGITAVWTANHSASIELARLAGPRFHTLTDAQLERFHLSRQGSRRLADGPVRCAVYETVLRSDTPFDIYRWVNLLDLAVTWPSLHLPRGVRHEWERALHAARLR